MVRTLRYLLILILVCSIHPILKCVYADWEEIKNIRFTSCYPRQSVDKLGECMKLAKAKHAQFFYSSETNKDCNICYDVDDSYPTTSWPYKSFVYIPNNPDESGLEFPVNMKSHLNITQYMNYIVRIMIKSEIDTYTFARFYCALYPEVIATCELKGLFIKSSEEINFDYKQFDGYVQFYMNFRTFATDGTLRHLILNALYVADHQPPIPGSSILNLIERMKEHFKIELISLTDISNVKLLSLYVYGTTYYQSHNYQYTNYKYNTQCVNIGHQQELLKNIQNTNISLTKLRSCILGAIRVSESITMRFDEIMHAFDTIFSGIIPIPNEELIEIKDLYTLNTQVLKKIKLPEHSEVKRKVIQSKRLFPKVLSACIYDQIVEYLEKDQIQCIKAIEENDDMRYVDTKIKIDTDIN